MKPIIVQKYGGSSLANHEAINRVADAVSRKASEGYRLCVVVSAMGKTTDSLIEQATAINSTPPRRELDMLMTIGERASAALLAMALEKRGHKACSLTGSQAGIITSASHADAQILEVRPYRVQDALAQDKVVVLAGFQGVSTTKEITTLGRGGSDTTAVAMAAALSAEACEIYSDVDGVYTADPRVVSDAKKLSALSFQEMQELAVAGAKVLNAQAVQFAKDKNIALFARQTGNDNIGTQIRLNPPTVSGGVRGVAHLQTIYYLHARPQKLADANSFFQKLHSIGRPNFIDISREASCYACVTVLNPENIHASKSMLTEQLDAALRDDLGVISLVGQGILSSSDVLSKSLSLLADMNIDVHHVSSSSFRLSFVIPSNTVEEVVRKMHETFITRLA